MHMQQTFVQHNSSHLFPINSVTWGVQRSYVVLDRVGEAVIHQQLAFTWLQHICSFGHDANRASTALFSSCTQIRFPNMQQKSFEGWCCLMQRVRRWIPVIKREQLSCLCACGAESAHVSPAGWLMLLNTWRTSPAVCSFVSVNYG